MGGITISPLFLQKAWGKYVNRKADSFRYYELLHIIYYCSNVVCCSVLYQVTVQKYGITQDACVRCYPEIK